MKHENGLWQPPISRQEQPPKLQPSTDAVLREVASDLWRYRNAWDRARRFLTDEQQAYCMEATRD